MAGFTCKGCLQRHPGCHDKCEKYQAEKKANEELKAKKREYDILNGNILQQKSDGIRRAVRRDRRGRPARFGK